jgi:hypothetical protein
MQSAPYPAAGATGRLEHADIVAPGPWAVKTPSPHGRPQGDSDQKSSSGWVGPAACPSGQLLQCDININQPSANGQRLQRFALRVCFRGN